MWYPKNGKLFFQALAFSALQITANAQVNYVRIWDAVSPQSDPNAMMGKSEHEVHQSTQYLDGLGRPVQAVAKKASPLGQDMVAPIAYDEFGRERYKYLPYVSGSDGLYKPSPLSDQATFYSDNNLNSPVKGQGENYLYGRTDFEPSPLGRSTAAYAPGNSWVGSNVGTQQKYSTNSPTDAVQSWGVANSNALDVFGIYTTSTQYQAGSLYKNIVTDENGRQSIEFRDKDGHVVMKKVQLDPSVTDNGPGSGYTGWLCTYYIYDNLGRLRCTVQPEGVVALLNNGWDLTDATILAEQCFRYEYDQRSRTTMKKVPGADKVYMVYDAADRLVMAQDANMRQSGDWLTTSYDNLGRPVKTGIYNGGSFIGHWGNAYVSTNYPGSVGDLLTETHYDDYTNLPRLLATYDNSWDVNFSPTSNNTPFPQMPAQNTSLKGLATWTQAKVLGTSNYLSSMTVYDDKARPIQTKSENISGGTDISTTQYSWSGQSLVTVKEQKNGATSQITTVVSQASYDAMGRVLTTQKKVSSNTINGGAWSNLATTANMLYDEIGHPKQKKLGNKAYAPGTYYSTIPLETQTFEYNIRGWLLGMNRDYVWDMGYTNAAADKDAVGTDGELYGGPNGSPNYFGFSMGYGQGGNIANMAWKGANDLRLRQYGYTYDAVNRLLTADFNQWTNSSFNRDAGVVFNTATTYDANGNITGLYQAGLVGSGSQAIDQLAYTYQQGSSKLQSVADYSGFAANGSLGDFKGSGGNYGYDANGNMNADPNKNISGISYNHLNLPKQIDVTGKGSISYVYDAAGNKLQKTVDENGNLTTTTYIDGFIYVNDVLQSMPQEEGRIRVNNGTYVFDYFLKDHLGNTRMTITDDYTYSNVIVDWTHYYPFGLTMAGISYKANGSLENKFKYNGNELQSGEFSDKSGLDAYDMNARTYDYQLLRFWQIDPLSDVGGQENNTPYHFSFNNPILRKDPTGKFAPIYDQNGVFLGTDDQGLKGLGIVMDKSKFEQGMKHEDALSNNLGAEGLKDNTAAAKLTQHWNGLKDRPDYDGELTLGEANNWYVNGNGAPLFVDAAKIGISPTVSFEDLTQGETTMVNFFAYPFDNLQTGLVYGTLQLKLLDGQGNVKIGDDNHKIDTYDFDQQKGRFGRNAATKAGEIVADGFSSKKGTGYSIYGYGLGKLIKPALISAPNKK